ncbi:helicase domain protein (plasmid) [Rhizobium leguminosarum bv. trifolii WSM2304]|uniref:Helicase domain protein n=1 Tax=Rhizobium leguminosarum bv. trifolii (strain WSM2304) TaxID=395492 RepID=A0ABF7QZJ6_RHILW|nr:helicase domain protein [Rhizobium leguminosarum bv. trifolii WSM2304]
MAHDDPFTLDFFGNTALSSGFDIAGSAFSPALESGAVVSERAITKPAKSVAEPGTAKAVTRPKVDFRLEGGRGLARTWRERARDNIAAIRLAGEIERSGLPARPDQQTRLIRFTGFGASELANGMFRRPREDRFRTGWEELGGSLEASVGQAEYASLARCTQYAHFTPEFIVRAIWAGLVRMGFAGGRVLEPGIGTGLFPALMPKAISARSHVTGVELDPVSARIVRLLQPRAKIVAGDFCRAGLPQHFDLAIGNPPFSDRTVRCRLALNRKNAAVHPRSWHLN